MSYSQTDSEISQNHRHSQYGKRDEYKNKIQTIWRNIQNTKKIGRSDSSTDERKLKQIYSKNKYGIRQQSQEKSPQKQNLTNIKQKRAKQLFSIYSQNKKKNIYPNKQLEQENSDNETKQLLFHEKIQNLQRQLQKSKANTNILMKKLIQAEEQIEYLEYELQKQMTQKQQSIDKLKTQSKVANDQKQNRTSNSKEIEARQIQNKMMADKYQFRLRAAQKQIQQKNNKIYYLQRQLEQTNEQLQKNKNKHSQNTYPNVNFKGSQLLELNEAYKTIERLVNLLKSTDQYRLLGNFAEQFKSIHFLSKIPKSIKTTLANIKISSRNKQKINVCNCTQIKINQRLLWTPQLCYKKMLQMKLKYDTLNQDCIEEVLFEMNKIYLSKEQTRVFKIKNSYEIQIQKLKKKTQLTYDQMLAKKQIQRLKKQIQTSKKISRKSSIKQSNDLLQDKNKVGAPRLKNLRAIGQYQDQLRLKEKQIKLLSERIKLLQTETSSYDKSLYMQGIIWIIDKMLEQLDTHSQDIREFQSKFRNKINYASTPEDWLRMYKQFFESVEELNHLLIQKILIIKESTLSKIDKSKMI